VSQLSLFGATAREPAFADLDGLLAGNGKVVRRDRSARLSVVVTEPWRAQVLAAQMAELLGLDAETAPAELGLTVRTPWLTDLLPVADAWSRGAVKVPPPGWVLDGARLRWWCLAEGSAAAEVYTLHLGGSDQQSWLAIGSALAIAGVPGVLVGPRADGPAYRIVGRRRLGRLVELVGEPPVGVPSTAWPTAHWNARPADERLREQRGEEHRGGTGER
jgi:hypothetical protein